MDRRIKIIFGIFCVWFIITGMRLWYMQIVHRTKFAALSFRNRARLVKLPSARGIIYDREGRIIADNKAATQLVVMIDNTSDFKGLSDEISRLTNLSKDYILKKIKENIFRPFMPSVLAGDMNDETLINIAEARWHLSGVGIQVVPVRDYLLGEIFSHIVGYTGEAGNDDLQSGYSWGDVVGRCGIEKDLDKELRGKDGYKEVEVDYRGNVNSVLDTVEPQIGSSLSLSIDLDLQEELFKAMAGHRGCGIVIDPLTGDLLAMVSLPAFNPNIFVSPAKEEIVADLFKSKNRPMINRAVSGLYPPGSIFKIIVALAALEKGVIKKKTLFYCDGEFQLGDTKFKCWEKKGHGWIDLSNALKRSCNEYFYQVGLKTKEEAIIDMAERFGFGKLTGVKISGEKYGFLPLKEIREGKWFAGDTVNLSIGHGKILVTPIQTACFISAVANEGLLYRPRLVMGEEKSWKEIDIKREYLDCIREGLLRVVNEHDGTGHNVYIDGLDIYGKTGTVELKEGKGKRDICWFAGFCNTDEHKSIAVVIVTEEGESGGTTAAPIAKKVFKRWKSKFLVDSL